MSRPLYSLGKPPGIFCIGGWMGPQARSGQFGEEKILPPPPPLGIEPRFLGRPVRSE